MIKREFDLLLRRGPDYMPLLRSALLATVFPEPRVFLEYNAMTNEELSSLDKVIKDINPNAKLVIQSNVDLAKLYHTGVIIGKEAMLSPDFNLNNMRNEAEVILKISSGKYINIANDLKIPSVKVNLNNTNIAILPDLIKQFYCTDLQRMYLLNATSSLLTSKDEKTQKEIRPVIDIADVARILKLPNPSLIDKKGIYNIPC